MEAKKLALFIKETAENKKAEGSIILDMRRASNLCDYFFICSGTSTRQSKAIADAIMEELKKKGIRPWHLEGYDEGRWILLDYNSVAAHIFHAEARSFYKLERLWGDAPIMDPGKQDKKTRCRKTPSKKKSPA